MNRKKPSQRRTLTRWKGRTELVRKRKEREPVRGTHELERGLGVDFILTNPLTGVEEERVQGAGAGVGVTVPLFFIIRRLFRLLGRLQVQFGLGDFRV